jgi:magnesium transporter
MDMEENNILPMIYFSNNNNINNNKNESLIWTDIQNPNKNKINLLAQRYPSFNSLNLDDCLSKIQIPKIDRYQDHIFIILYFPIAEKEKEKDEDIYRISQLSIFLGRNYLVTIHQGNLIPIVEMFCQCKGNKRSNTSSSSYTNINEYRHDQEPLTPSFMEKKSYSIYLFYKILDVLVDDLLRILNHVTERLEDIEDDVFNDKIILTKRISLLRRDIATLSRIAIPLKQIIMEIMTKDIQNLLDEKDIHRQQEGSSDSVDDLVLFFSDLKDHIGKVIEALDSSNKTIAIYQDTNFMLSNDKTNRALTVLTIMFTLTIPITVISAIYGMNVKIPGGNEMPWTLFGPYTTFVLLLLGSAIASLVMLWSFYYFGWITAKLRK